MFYVYIVFSSGSGQWYYGCTKRLDERIDEHNWNNGHFTGGKGPWELIFKRPFETQSEALAFEKYLKKLRNKEYIRQQFSGYFIKQ